MEEFKKRVFSVDFPDDLNHAIAFFRGILSDTRLTTILTVQKLTTKQLDWQYKEGWNTIGALLSHISALQHYFRIIYIEKRTMTQEESDGLIPALDMGIYLPSLISGKSISNYLNELNQAQDKFLQSLLTLTFEDFSKVLQNNDYGENCNLAWVLFHMVEDEIYHRGQISILLKIMRGSENVLSQK
ncbi:DinB family protein [Sphingobacterium siyangense]|uniref:DinB family protein n=1 Tax=Sphingobacterium siyangense TaxID=459529 RepID=UPI003DA696A2